METLHNYVLAVCTRLSLASYPGRKGLVHIASACAGGPQKKLGESDTIVYSPFIIHRTARHAKSVSDHHGNATGHYGDASACARNVYQALLSPPEGPGYEARLSFSLSALLQG